MVFYTEVPLSEATYVYVQTEDGVSDIEGIQQEG